MLRTYMPGIYQVRQVRAKVPYELVKALLVGKKRSFPNAIKKTVFCPETALPARARGPQTWASLRLMPKF